MNRLNHAELNLFAWAALLLVAVLARAH